MSAGCDGRSCMRGEADWAGSGCWWLFTRCIGLYLTDRCLQSPCPISRQEPLDKRLPEPHQTLSRPAIPRTTPTKMFDLAKSDVGRSNRIYSKGEILVIQNVMQDAEQHHDTSLVARCKVALAPHRKLPEDVLRCIFAFNTQEGIYLPFKQSNGKPVIPAAVLLTHVCTLWRRIALCSPELWNNVSLEMNNWGCSFLPCALELLSRARDLPMNLELTVLFRRRRSYDRDFDFGDAVRRLTTHHIIQKLRLNIHSYEDPEISPRDMFSAGTFDRIRDLDLYLDDKFSLPVFSQSGFPNLEAFCYYTTMVWGDPSLPYVSWSQLRRLDLENQEQDLPTTLGLLSQCTLIEECKLAVTVFGSAMVSKVTLHNLRDLEVEFIHVLDEDFDILDTFFSLLSFPNLQSLMVSGIEEDVTWRGISPLTRNLKLMAPQLHDLRFGISIDEGDLRTLLECMPSLHINRF